MGGCLRHYGMPDGYGAGGFWSQESWQCVGRRLHKRSVVRERHTPSAWLACRWTHEMKLSDDVLVKLREQPVPGGASFVSEDTCIRE